MLKIAGSAKLYFAFPAHPRTAYEYYSSDMQRVVKHLKHMTLVETGSDHWYRLLYQTTELGIYEISIYCDIQMRIDPENLQIQLVPTSNGNPIIEDVGLQHTRGYGQYSSQAFFHKISEEQTQVEYHLRLMADLKRPLGMRLMPHRVVNKIAQNITNRRIKEIAEGFIANSVAAFPIWSTQE